MTISNYNLLEQAIINYSKRRDASTLIPTFIALCENEIDKKLKLQLNEKIQTATLNTDDRYITLPSSLLSIRKMSIIQGGRHFSLEYKAPNSLRIRDFAAMPRLYTITANKVELECIPSDNFPIEIVYHSKLTPLTESNITNSVLTAFPNMYLFGTLAQLYLWARDEETANYYGQLFYKMMDDANAEEAKKRIGASPYARYEGDIP